MKKIASRRRFLRTSLTAATALGLPLWACEEGTNTPVADPEFTGKVRALLATWVEGMYARQIDAPDDLSRHGALGCAACDGLIHGRCMDAVYPFLRYAKDSGDPRYVDAAIRLYDWGEHNVAQDDGSWTVVPNPKTWRGITVFGAIALAEALHYHGDLLPTATRAAWTERLGRAGDYVFETFDLYFTNINYGYTALYALSLLGEMLERPHYRARAQVLAKDAADFLTEPNQLLYGETKPRSDRRSKAGLYGVDLGYNVEESLNGAVLYALRENDTALLAALEKSLAGHLEFMLPDGGWDNGWGTRSFKWTYWGSRTTDGCQPAFAAIADRNPAFGTAVIRSTELLERCTTRAGLLAGGLNYEQHDIPACIHHTFAHAKPLAYLLDAAGHLPVVNDRTPLPRTVADGMRSFPEIGVRLLARGPWRATVSVYDHLYKKDIVQGGGGSMTLLYHLDLGPLLVASLADYYEVERFNQQADPDGEDFALTPRITAYRGTEEFSNMYDLTAGFDAAENQADRLSLHTRATLMNQDFHPPEDAAAAVSFRYELEEDDCRIQAGYPLRNRLERAALILPVLVSSAETYRRVDERRLEIKKNGGTLIVTADVPLEIVPTKRERVFNMVPGVQALPLRLAFPPEQETVSCTFSLLKNQKTT